MARYDRIAPLHSPTREQAFPAWLALRDLEGRERDAELGRRARLRFLALRMVRRLLREGFDAVPVQSFERQIEGVREELGHLPARDVERTRLAQFLHQLVERDPHGVATGTLEMAQVIEELGHVHAAEEYYLTACEIADAKALVQIEVDALRLLGTLYHQQQRWTEATDVLTRSATLAWQHALTGEWAAATRLLAAGSLRLGDGAGAKQLLQQVAHRSAEWGNDVVTAGVVSDLAAVALHDGDIDSAVQLAWEAYRRVSDTSARSALLLQLATAFRAAGLHAAADRCYDLILDSTPGPQLRLTVLTDHAANAAEANRSSDFVARRAALLSRVSDLARDPNSRLRVELQLARASLLAGAADFARDHLREALALARRTGRADALNESEALLGALERIAAGGAVPQLRAERRSTTAERIALELESFTHPLVPSA